MASGAGTGQRRRWPDYAAVWRWHFYAGLFCMPFVLWLAVTGSAYLFRPDVEALLDRPYENLTLAGPRAAPASEARAAVAAVPGSTFSRYEPPATPTGAAQVVVARGGNLFRVYVQPRTLAPMSVERDDHRIMELVAHLHGNLLIGDTGSIIVELAASWAIVMILTGLYLWWPRGRKGLGGLLYPRLRLRGRPLWRDLHAAAGVWVSVITLFLLLSGLPWAKSWGNYMSWARNLSSVTAGKPTWPVGARQDPASVAGLRPPASARTPMPGMSAAEMAAMTGAAPSATGTPDLAALDRLVPLATRLAPPRPVWIVAPAAGSTEWTIESHIQDRPRRITYAVTPGGRVTGVSDFAGQNIVDKVVAVTTATHEGQLFGRLNQAVLLFTAASLILVTISGTVMWWRRRPATGLGAPPAAARPGAAPLLAGGIMSLAVLLPTFGISLAVVLVIDVALLPRLPSAQKWLGRNERLA
jgi:uncharacterized iron-regulated membrane protein